MLKLDRSIVDGVAADPVLRTLVKSMVDFGHGCAARSWPRASRPSRTPRRCSTLGVDYGQGWYFGRPGPRDALGTVAALDDVTVTAG